jgi:predicted nucleotide-binding protein (sugar kinase/HSP70/actin superfamily)
MLFQQKGGLKQATGEEAGLAMNPDFFMGLLKAIISGDVINGMGYRLRPYEAVTGETDRVIENTKKYVYDALVEGKSVLAALMRGKAEFGKIKLDWTRPAARVSIIGEFWAMTTEGDGNYHLQRFLEGEGAECDIQFVTNWLLFMLWEGRYDTKLRAELRGVDDARKGLKNVSIGKKLAGLFVADLAIRAAFHLFGAAVGYRGYHLPDMDEVASAAHKYYDNNVRGGEGHMEVGKFILNVLHNKAHMTLSVKPFGCMPSSGVSDGIQSMITSLYPQSIFCAIETSGDGKVNVQSRVQMFLFKARLAAQKEYQEALAKLGVTAETVEAFYASHPKYGSGLHRAPHAAAGTAADRLAEVAPLLGKSPVQVRLTEARLAAAKVVETVRGLPATLTKLRKKIAHRSPQLFAQAREEWIEARPVLTEKLKQAARARAEAFGIPIPAARPAAAENQAQA